MSLSSASAALVLGFLYISLDFLYLIIQKGNRCGPQVVLLLPCSFRNITFIHKLAKNRHLLCLGKRNGINFTVPYAPCVLKFRDL
jgi:hypothetical protein